MRVQRTEVVKPRATSISGMRVGEAYKHPELPDLYMRVEISGSTCYVINLESGRRAEINDSFVTGWIHCPNAVCKEEDD